MEALTKNASHYQANCLNPKGCTRDGHIRTGKVKYDEDAENHIRVAIRKVKNSSGSYRWGKGNNCQDQKYKESQKRSVRTLLSPFHNSSQKTHRAQWEYQPVLEID